MNLPLAHLRERLITGFWFVPIGCCLVSALLAIAMIPVEQYVNRLGYIDPDLSMSVASARQTLGVIAGSVISVGGVAFSVIMVALTLTSGQYGPKVLRHFLEDQGIKLSLGLFLGTFVYALTALALISIAGTSGLTVLVAMLLAFLALIGFVAFIHRTANDLQADEIVRRLGEQLGEGLHAIVDDSGEPGHSADTLPWRREARGCRAVTVGATRSGYVQTIDYAGLTAWCAGHECFIKVLVRSGDFVVEGIGLLKVYGADEAPEGTRAEALNEFIVFGPIRTPIQDPEYPISQINQLAARALSPGINDPETAISCLDAFVKALAIIIDRDLRGGVFRDAGGRPRLLARVSDFAGILKAIYSPLRQFAGNDVAVTVRLLECLERLARLTRRGDRLALMAGHGRLIWENVERAGIADIDLTDIRQRYRSLLAASGDSLLNS